MRAYGVDGDEMALRLFDQQAAALGRLFTIAANYSDPSVYFVGGGVVEAAPHFRDWFLERVRAHTTLREEQAALATSRWFRIATWPAPVDPPWQRWPCCALNCEPLARLDRSRHSALRSRQAGFPRCSEATCM